MTRLQRLICGAIGLFMLVGGANKFREPFITMFAEQIRLSGLPFPTLSTWAGEMGEIFAGNTLLVLTFFRKHLPLAVADKLFYLGNALIVFIMCVAVYVHLHPVVPAEILPFGYKPPLSTIVTLLLAVLNMYLHRRTLLAATA